MSRLFSASFPGQEGRLFPGVFGPVDSRHITLAISPDHLLGGETADLLEMHNNSVNRKVLEDSIVEIIL